MGHNGSLSSHAFELGDQPMVIDLPVERGQMKHFRANFLGDSESFGMRCAAQEVHNLVAQTPPHRSRTHGVRHHRRKHYRGEPGERTCGISLLPKSPLGKTGGRQSRVSERSTQEARPDALTACWDPACPGRLHNRQGMSEAGETTPTSGAERTAYSSAIRSRHAIIESRET